MAAELPAGSDGAASDVETVPRRRDRSRSVSSTSWHTGPSGATSSSHSSLSAGFLDAASGHGAHAGGGPNRGASPPKGPTSAAGDLAAAPFVLMSPMGMYGPPVTGMPSAFSTGAPPAATSRRSGSTGLTTASFSGRSSSAGAHWGGSAYQHHYQAPQPYPDYRSASAALPQHPRLSDISESEDDTGDEDSPRASTPPRNRQRNRRSNTARYDVLFSLCPSHLRGYLRSVFSLSFRSGSADNQSGGAGQPQYFSRWKLNKSVIPPEIQAYTDQVRRQHLIIDDSRDGTGSASSATNPSPRSPLRTASKAAPNAVIKSEGRSQIPSLNLQQHADPVSPQGARTSSLPAHVYMQYAGFAPLTPFSPVDSTVSQSPHTSLPSSPRASSASATPSWGLAPNPFFPHHPGQSQTGDIFFPRPSSAYIGFPPTAAAGPAVAPPMLPSLSMPFTAQSALPPFYATGFPHGMTAATAGRFGLPLVTPPETAAHLPTSPRTSSSVFSPFARNAGTAAGGSAASLEELMKEKLFTLADVASHSSPAPEASSSAMDIAEASDDDDNGNEDENSDDRSGGARMQL